MLWILVLDHIHMYNILFRPFKMNNNTIYYNKSILYTVKNGIDHFFDHNILYKNQMKQCFYHNYYYLFYENIFLFFIFSMLETIAINSNSKQWLVACAEYYGEFNIKLFWLIIFFTITFCRIGSTNMQYSQ